VGRVRCIDPMDLLGLTGPKYLKPIRRSALSEAERSNDGPTAKTDNRN
jgi:hypothetical protein